MSTLDEPTPDAQPAAASTAVALAGALLVVAALLRRVEDVFWPVALGAVGAVLFALSCWLLSRERFETVARPLVSVLALPVALGLFGSTAVVTLVLASAQFPVPEGAMFSATALHIAGHAGVVFGSVLALLGVTLGARAVVTPTVLERYGNTLLATATVPGLYAVAVTVEVVVFQQRGPLTAALDAAGLGWAWLTAAHPTGLDLAGFLFTLALAVTSVLAAVVVLPVAELLDDPAADERVDHLRTWLTRAGAAVIGLHLAVLGLELRYADPELVALLGATPYGLLELVGTARSLRYLLLAVAVVALTVTALGWVTRRLARQTSRGYAHLVGPFVGGAFITLLAILVAGRVYDTLLGLVLASLPPATEAEVNQAAAEAAFLYGEELFVVMLAFTLVVATLCFVLAVRVALFFGYLSTESPGFSLTSAGLLFAVVAAGTIGAPAWLVFGGVLCSLLVWDAGRFGTTLSREIGSRAETRDTELVHTGATLGVGLAGVAAASLVVSRVDTVWVFPSPTTSLALVALAAGLVCFAIALR